MSDAKVASSCVPLVVVAAALVDGEGRVLVQRRPRRSIHAGLWEFPGGKVEAGEAFEAALIRELDEELGIAVDAAALSPACFASEPIGDRHLLLLLYLCRKWRGAPRALQADALSWVTAAELQDLDMPPADEPLVAQLRALI